MTPNQFGKFKFALETRLKELSGTPRNRETITVERTSDVLDEVELAGERDLAIWGLDRWFAQLRLVEAALDRIAERTYGRCLRCDEEISVRRLTALPHALFCITCQEAADHSESRESGITKELTGSYERV